MEIYILWNAGCDIMEIDVYNKDIEWHNDSDVFKGTKKECEKELKNRENRAGIKHHEMAYGFDY